MTILELVGIGKVLDTTITTNIKYTCHARCQNPYCYGTSTVSLRYFLSEPAEDFPPPLKKGAREAAGDFPPTAGGSVIASNMFVKSSAMAKSKNQVERVKHPVEIEEDIDLHEKGWVVQRIGWLLMILVMLAGALGLFGEGLLSSKTTKLGDVTTEYDRFFRYETEMKIVVQSAATGISAIALPQQYLKQFRIVRFVPEPDENIADTDNVVFNFKGTKNHIVTLYAVPKTYGSVTGNMTVNNNSSIQLNHFIYP